MKNVKIVVFVPLTHTDKVRGAIGKAGGGNIGNYSIVLSLLQELADSNQMKKQILILAKLTN